MPKVSVCIPVYNGEKYIKKTIQSVLDQTFKDFELLIIDNVSTDNTDKIVNSFSDSRIRYQKNLKNLGMVSNWNCCLDNTKGDYIQFLCADDYLDKSCLEKKVNALNSDSKISLVFNSTYIVNNYDKVILKRRPYHKNMVFDGKLIGRKSFTKKNIYGEPSNVMFKKEDSKKIGYFDSKLCYAPDWDYWIKLSMLGKVCYIDDFLVYYRVSSVSETSNLLKTKEKLVFDDAQFIGNCLENKLLKLNKMDVLLHKFNLKNRMYLRQLFYYINSYRYRSNIK